MATVKTKLIIVTLLLLVVLQETSSLFGRRRRRRRRSPPPKVNCKWSPWSEEKCNHECGNSGLKIRRRTEVVKASGGGAGCLGKAVENLPCNRFCYNGGTPMDGHCTCPSPYSGKCCSVCTVKNCLWGEWGNWSECVPDCGVSRYKTRSRIVRQQAQCGGSPCTGTPTEKLGCEPICLNGGTFLDGRCQCVTPYSGDCCHAVDSPPPKLYVQPELYLEERSDGFYLLCVFEYPDHANASFDVIWSTEKYVLGRASLFMSRKATLPGRNINDISYLMIYCKVTAKFIYADGTAKSLPSSAIRSRNILICTKELHNLPMNTNGLIYFFGILFIIIFVVEFIVRRKRRRMPADKVEKDHTMAKQEKWSQPISKKRLNLFGYLRFRSETPSERALKENKNIYKKRATYRNQETHGLTSTDVERVNDDF